MTELDQLRSHFYGTKRDLSNARHARYYAGFVGTTAEIKRLTSLLYAIHAEMRVLDPSTDLWGGAGPDNRPIAA